ncbi:SpoIIAA family protein [Salinimicrobium flavum]|uniref:STAS/SEC14 domain-containing protein n=1 Tax=Salinimicrobium flavum TaxID=1737065 RepID=A0ABW5IZX8_9FLAO
MVSIQTAQNVIYTIAEEKLTDEDYDRIIPLLQEKVRSYGKIRWYFEMSDFDGWTLSALWRDLKFDIKNLENIERIAMVGEEKWQKHLTELMKPFTTAKIEFFPLAERERARNWIGKFK